MEEDVKQFLILCAFMIVHSMAIAAPPQMHRDEEVTFQNGAITIAGTLSVPAGRGPFPAVVLLSGSGPQNRDSELGEFRPFKLIAESFAQRGIAVLRCDDRGVGGSSGSVAESTTEAFADDALAAIGMLRARPEIDRTRIGLVGHSEGAIAAAIAASRSADVAFVVWMAGSAVPGAEILRMQAAALARSAGATDGVVNEILRQHAALTAAIAEDAPVEKMIAIGRALAAAQMTVLPESQRPASAELPAAAERVVSANLAILRSPWMRFFVSFDPSTVLRRVACPVFAAFGGRDLQVPAEANRARLEAALTAGQNQDVIVRVYADANHLFMKAVTGQPREYAVLPKQFVPSLLDDIGEWIAKR